MSHVVINVGLFAAIAAATANTAATSIPFNGEKVAIIMCIVTAGLLVRNWLARKGWLCPLSAIAGIGFLVGHEAGLRFLQAYDFDREAYFMDSWQVRIIFYSGAFVLAGLDALDYNYEFIKKSKSWFRHLKVRAKAKRKPEKGLKI